MESRILGSVEVVDDGRPVSIRRGKELALLAYLLLHANEVVPSERLIDELWGERPPGDGGQDPPNAVSQLRKALGDDRLLTRPPGYILRVDPGELDLERFEALAGAAGQPVIPGCCVRRSSSGVVCRSRICGTNRSRRARRAGSRSCGWRRTRIDSRRISRTGATPSSFPSSRA